MYKRQTLAVATRGKKKTLAAVTRGTNTGCGDQRKEQTLPAATRRENKHWLQRSANQSLSHCLAFRFYIWNNLSQDISLLSLPSKANSKHFFSPNISDKQHSPSLVRVCVCVCVRACVRACVCARACVHLAYSYV